MALYPSQEQEISPIIITDGSGGYIEGGFLRDAEQAYQLELRWVRQLSHIGEFRY